MLGHSCSVRDFNSKKSVKIESPKHLEALTSITHAVVQQAHSVGVFKNKIHPLDKTSFLMIQFFSLRDEARIAWSRVQHPHLKRAHRFEIESGRL